MNLPIHHRELPGVPKYDVVRRLWKELRLAHGAKPITGALVVGAAASVLAVELGPAEFVVGALAAYAAYRMLRYGVDLKQAFAETFELERGAMPPL